MEKLDQAEHALDRLASILDEPYSVIVRDATIQRFEYCSEVVWKAAREWLRAHESIQENHPRGCFRELFSIGRIDEALSLQLLKSIEDRNRTSHTYIETLAKSVFARIPEHCAAFQKVIQNLKS